MGLGDLFHHMHDPVRGTALVADINDWTPGRNPHPLHATLVVQADGVPKTTVEHKEMVGASVSAKKLIRWPSQGDTIPVTVDRADPTKVRIEWDEMRSASEVYESQREERKQQLLADAYGEDEHPRPHKLP